MADSSDDTDSQLAEPSSFFAENHQCETEGASCQTVNHHRHIAIRKTGQKNNPCQRNGNGSSCSYEVQGYDIHQVCQSQFDSRYSEADRNQCFHIA